MNWEEKKAYQVKQLGKMKYTTGTKVYWKSGNLYGETTGKVRDIAGIKLYEIKFDNGKFKYLQETQLQIMQEEVLDFSSLFHVRNFADFQHFRQYLTHRRIKGGLTNVVYSMKYGDVKFLPYQFKPVFKFIEANEQRLLIADEVGLGKTIESLYIWKELQAREDALRLLVVCPAMLRGKWKKDMEVHFGMEAQIVDSKELLELCKDAKMNRSKPFVLITSLEGIRQKVTDDDKLNEKEKKRKSVLLNQFFEEVYEDPDFNELFDLAVFDEAAKLTNSETANFATGKRINRISKNLLLLSATPVSNSQSDLYSLLRLLSPSEYRNEDEFNRQYEQNRAVVNLAHCFYYPVHNFDEIFEQANFWIEEVKKTQAFGNDPYFAKLQNNLKEHLLSDELRRKTYDQLTDRFFYSSVFSRSRKRDVIDDIAIRSAQTADFELSDFELEIYEACTKELEEMCMEEHDRIFAFGIMARQRELASSVPAAIRRWRQTFYSHEDVNEEDRYEDNDEGKKVPSIPETAISLSEDDLKRLEKEDRKYKKFVSAIKEKIEEGKKEIKNEKIVVFSFFRQTLNYLLHRLNSDGVSALMIMGGMDQEEKDSNLTRFREDESVSVLLSSEVGAEGLDMQFSSLEFNYDLPWNPMRLEQRIGRIDRIGQEAKRIRIVNMFCSNTIEDRILQKLYTKINIFKESIGELDEILGQQTQEIERSLLSHNLSKEDKEKQADAAIDKFYEDLQTVKKLEESAGLSKAYSDSIIDFVNTAEKNSRYIRKEDIINYLYDYFTKDGHGSHFSRNDKYPDCWDLELSDSDRHSLNNYLSATGKYFAGANKNKMICTFPQGKKVVNHSFVNIDVNHPILKWVYDCTEKVMENSGISNCFTLNIPSSAINREVFDKNAYAFYLCYFECEGLKKKKELLYFVCSPEDLSVKSQLDSENFVAQSLFNGNAVTNLKTKLTVLNSKAIDQALECCKTEFINAASSMKTELEDNNDAVYHRMMAKTRSYYEDKIEGIKQSIKEKESEALEYSYELSFDIKKDCGIDYEAKDLYEKAGAIRRFVSLKTESERQKFNELSDSSKERLVLLTTTSKDGISRLQKYGSTIKGFHTMLDNAQVQYRNAVTGVEMKKKLIINFEELGGGIVFVD